VKNNHGAFRRQVVDCWENRSTLSSNQASGMGGVANLSNNPNNASPSATVVEPANPHKKNHDQLNSVV
jgi:hypothetical protein